MARWTRARWALPEMSPWRWQPLTIPPDSWRAWMQLAVWEIWMGLLLGGALTFGMGLIVTAPRNIVTVMDFRNCSGVSSIAQPCGQVVYRAGTLNVAFNVWFGLLLIGLAVWLLWELWTAVEPKPITDDFLKLLDDSFGRSWTSLRTWPWARLAWAYGFTLVGAATPVAIALSVSSVTR